MVEYKQLDDKIPEILPVGTTLWAIITPIIELRKNYLIAPDRPADNLVVNFFIAETRILGCSLEKIGDRVVVHYNLDCDYNIPEGYLFRTHDEAADKFWPMVVKDILDSHDSSTEDIFRKRFVIFALPYDVYKERKEIRYKVELRREEIASRMFREGSRG